MARKSPTVSIPSSSGLGLEQLQEMQALKLQGKGLNPFFIRSRFGTFVALAVIVWRTMICLNPFFIRSRFGTLRHT